MKVILTEDVVGVGDIGEVINVKPGYARNFLIPRGFAVESESASARVSEHRVRQIEAKKRRLKGVASERAKALEGFTLQMELRVGGSGRVFGSISARDIASELAKHGYELDRRRVLISEPIRRLGEHPIRVKLHQEVESEIKLNVVGRESTDAEDGQDVGNARRNMEAAAADREDDDASEE